MPSAFEIARSGRAKCRGCGDAIAKHTLRFGERMENPFGEGEMTLWFHPPCGAMYRPEPFLATLAETESEVAEHDMLAALAREGLAHRRLPRLHGIERSPTSRARCRSCRELIAADAWRLLLVYYEEGRFEPSGFVHLACAGVYFGTTDLMPRLERLAELSATELEEVRHTLEAAIPGAG